MCSTCNNNSCNGNCSVTRQITNNNNSIGRDGESAYQIAVRNGYDGTEEQWLDSMKAKYSTITGSPYDSPALKVALDAKVDITDLDIIDGND